MGEEESVLCDVNHFLGIDRSLGPLGGREKEERPEPGDRYSKPCWKGR